MAAPQMHRQEPDLTVWLGDAVDVLRAMPADSLDAGVLDPPYALPGGFMGKSWDQFTGGRLFQQWCEEWAREAYRVLKPGAHLLAFGGTRTYHRLTCGIEDAGFEIRDSITCWLYASGFPKSHDVSKAIDDAAGAEREVVGSKLGLPGYSMTDGNGDHRTYSRGIGNTGSGSAECAVTAPATAEAQQWSGFGTALKPAWEPIVVARKPLAGTVAGNVLRYGTGALNIDACRVGNDQRVNQAGGASSLQRVSRVMHGYREHVTTSVGEASAVTGRWPSNVLLSHAGYVEADGTEVDLCAEGCIPGCPVRELDGQSGVRSSGSRAAGTYGLMGYQGADAASMPAITGDTGGASRFFPAFRFEAKAPSSERPSYYGPLCGCLNEVLPVNWPSWARARDGACPTCGTATGPVQHPTVKPEALMRWLVRLACPPGGTVGDWFAGTGTTGAAALVEGMKVVLVDETSPYLPLVDQRIARARYTPRGRARARVVKQAAPVDDDELLFTGLED